LANGGGIRTGAGINRTLFRWHRRIGVTSALFVLILSITGLLLMFGNGLGLDQKTWSGPLVNSVYNLEPASKPIGIELKDEQGDSHWIVMVDGLVYVGDADPVTLAPPLLSAAWQDEFVAFANTEELVVTLRDGTMVERSGSGGFFDGTGPSQIPAEIKAEVLNRYAGRGLPASRILLDIHTGRFFGAIGTWIMALATILLILLSITGLIMWTKTDQRRAKRERMKKELAKLKGEGN
jgi:hypothetical protein